MWQHKSRLAWTGMALAAVLLFTLLAARPAMPAAGSAAVDPRILVEMAAAPDGTAGFFVLFREQADLAPAYAIADWNERGRFVVAALQSTAGRSQARVRAWLDARGLTYRVFIVANSLFVTADRSALGALAAFPEVAALRANAVHPVADIPLAAAAAPEAEIPWNIARVGADQVWADFGVKGQGIVVATIDTGVEYTHDALFPNYKCGAGPHDDCWEDPTGTYPTAPGDGNGHGTFLTGIMAGDDVVTLTMNVGMAPDAQWIACKACSDGGVCSDYTLNACVGWLLEPNGNSANRPHIILFALSSDSSGWFVPQIGVWQSAGILVVTKPGNDGPDCNTMQWPGAEIGLTAGATDEDDLIGWFSSRGPGPYGLIKPHVTAPGVEVCSTYPVNSWICDYSGTACSTAHAAGLAALLYSADPALIGNAVSTTLAITSTALCIEDLSCGGTPCPDGANNVYGWGRIDAYAAVEELLQPCAPVTSADFAWEPPLPIVGEVVTFSASATGTAPITYSWQLGDGSWLAGPVVSHTYDMPGVYAVVLTATNCTTATAVVTHNVTVQLCELVYDLDFSWTPFTPTAGQPLTLTAAAAGTPPMAYSWQLGDGSWLAGPVVTHTYAAPGIYTVALTATNCAGQGVATATRALAVQPPPCVPLREVDFAWTPEAPFAGDLITLTGTATGTAPITYSWRLEVGSWKEGAVVTHTYDAAGSYTVVLTATNCGTATAVTSHTIAVTGPPPCEPVQEVDFSWAPPTPTAGLPLTLTAWAPGGGWLTTTVDSAGDVGSFAALGLDPAGRPHVGSYDATHADLRYAHDDGTGWQLMTVDSAGDVGSFTSIAVDALGQPHLSYYDAGSYDLKYAHYDGAWHTQTVDGAGSVGRCSSLALDGLGRPHIAYYDEGNGAIRYASYDGAWHTQTVDPAVGGVCDTALGLDAAGRPHVAYMVNTYELRYAYLDGTWQYEAIAANGERPDLALDAAGRPHVSYYANGEVLYAYRDGAGWHSEALENVGWPTVVSSLALDDGDAPHISYYRGADFVLRYARRAGSAWDIVTVDGAGSAGVYNALALDAAGRPRLAYAAGDTADLRYAWWNGPPTEPLAYTWKLEAAGWAAGAVVTHTYAAPGDYAVVLTATNCVSATATAVHTLTVACAPVSGVDFAWEPLTPTAGQVVTLTAAAESALPVTYAWDLGDGAGAAGPVVTHAYAAGTYTVVVTATNGCAAAQRARIVTVGAPWYKAYLPLVFRE